MEFPVSKVIDKYDREIHEGPYRYVALVGISIWMLVVGFLVHRSGVALDELPQFVLVHVVAVVGLASFVVFGDWLRGAK